MGAMVVEQCRISAANGTHFSLPLSFFDMFWYDNPIDHNLLVFEFTCSESLFLETLVPELKKSISLTLDHFLPLAGNIIHSGNKPVIDYTPTDSVSCTFAIYRGSATEFLNRLSGNKSSSELHCFAPWLPPSSCDSETGITTCPTFALQVTLLPGHGICICFASHHAVSDACSTVAFARAWGLIHSNMTSINVNSSSDDEYSSSDDDCQSSMKSLLIRENCLPFYGRKAAIDLVNVLDSKYWSLILQNHTSPIRYEKLQAITDPCMITGKVRSTFILTKDEINDLKKYYILASKRNNNSKVVNHLSSFVVVCALVWFCSAKSAAAGKEKVTDDEIECFGFMVDCRGRFPSPPLPPNYFGNCVVPTTVELRHGELKGDNGFTIAVESIGERIREKVHEKGILESAQEWSEYRKTLISKRQCWVAGSPRFDYYAADFGWGRATRFEPRYTTDDVAFSLSKSRDFEGGLEICLAKTANQMEAYNAVFTEVLADVVSLKLQQLK